MDRDSTVTDKYGKLRGIGRRFVRRQSDGKGGTTFVDVAKGEELVWSDDAAQIGACKAGTLVLTHGCVLHQSKKNLSDRSKRVSSQQQSNELLLVIHFLCPELTTLRFRHQVHLHVPHDRRRREQGQIRGVELAAADQENSLQPALLPAACSVSAVLVRFFVSR